MSVSSSSWGLGRAAVCNCGTPWTFLLLFFLVIRHPTVCLRDYQVCLGDTLLSVDPHLRVLACVNVHLNVSEHVCTHLLQNCLCLCETPVCQCKSVMVFDSTCAHVGLCSRPTLFRSLNLIDLPLNLILCRYALHFCRDRFSREYDCAYAVMYLHAFLRIYLLVHVHAHAQVCLFFSVRVCCLCIRLCVVCWCIYICNIYMYEGESISNQPKLFPVEIHHFFFDVIAL